MVKNPPANAGLIPGEGRSPGEGNGNPLEHTCLRNLMNRGYSPWGHKRFRHDLLTKQQQNPHDCRPASPRTQPFSLSLFFFSLMKVLWSLHCVCMLSCFSHVRLFATPWTVACQAPLSMEFSRQEYWNGLPLPPAGNLPDPGIEPTSPAALALQADSLPLSHEESSMKLMLSLKK